MFTRIRGAQSLTIYSRLSTFLFAAFLLPILNGATTPNWTGTINAVPDAYGIHRTGGCEGCDAGGISLQEIAPAKGGSIQFTASPGPYRLLGLTPGRDLSFSGMAYAIGIGTSDLAEISEGGSYRASIPFESGDLFQISVEGGKVFYLKNGEVVYTSSSVPSAALHVEALLLDLSSRIDNPRFNPRRASTPQTLPSRPTLKNLRAQRQEHPIHS